MLLIKGNCFMGSFSANITWLFAFFLGLLERSFSPAQVRWNVKTDNVTSSGRDVDPHRWLNLLFIYLNIFLISFFSMCRLDQLTHIALWNLKPENQLNRLYLQWTIEMFMRRWVKESWKIWIINVVMSGQEKWYEIHFPSQQASKFQFSLAPT